MGILSGMLVAACIAFFSKKKLTKNTDTHTENQESCISHNNESKLDPTTKNKKTPRLKNLIKAWIAKILGKK